MPCVQALEDSKLKDNMNHDKNNNLKESVIGCIFLEA